MNIAKAVIAAGLLATSLSLAGCYNDRPGRWGDHHHRGHHHGHGHGHHGHDGHHDHGRR